MENEKYNGGEGRGGDLVLAQGEMALVQDGANGNVDVIVGPYLHSLSKSDSPVIYEAEQGHFKKCSVREATKLWPSAKEGQYIVLENPALDDWAKHPDKGKIKSTELGTGRKVNVPGPITFPLFPGQSAEVIGGHILRTNQYLLVRVINGEEAMKNWRQAILKPQMPDTTEWVFKKLGISLISSGKPSVKNVM